MIVRNEQKIAFYKSRINKQHSLYINLFFVKSGMHDDQNDPVVIPGQEKIHYCSFFNEDGTAVTTLYNLRSISIAS